MQIQADLRFTVVAVKVPSASEMVINNNTKEKVLLRFHCVTLLTATYHRRYDILEFQRHQCNNAEYNNTNNSVLLAT